MVDIAVVYEIEHIYVQLLSHVLVLQFETRRFTAAC